MIVVSLATLSQPTNVVSEDENAQNRRRSEKILYKEGVHSKITWSFRKKAHQIVSINESPPTVWRFANQALIEAIENRIKHAFTTAPSAAELRFFLFFLSKLFENITKRMIYINFHSINLSFITTKSGFYWALIFPQRIVYTLIYLNQPPQHN